MATKREYAKRLRELLRNARRMNRKTAKGTLELIARLHDGVASAILSAQGFDLNHLQTIKNEVERTAAQFAAQYKNLLTSDIVKAWTLGREIVDTGLQAASPQTALSVAAMPFVGQNELAILQGFSADLVRNISEEVRGKINLAIQTGILGKQTPFEVMREIEGTGIGRGIFKSVEHRAEVISRTELNRVLNLGMQSRVEQAGGRIDNVKKFWIHTDDERARESHIAVGRATNPKHGGKPIPYADDFVVGGERAAGPYAPGLSAEETIQCRCTYGVTIE